MHASATSPTPFAITGTNPFHDNAPKRSEPHATTSPKSVDLPSVTSAGSRAPSSATAAGQIYTAALGRNDTLSADAKAIAGAVLPATHGGFSAPAVRVSPFAANGVQANDMMVIQRVAPELGKPNVVLYMPEKDGASFHEFNDTNEMNGWLKRQLETPANLDRFASHFQNGVFSERTEVAKNLLAQFRDGDINAVVGAYGEEHDDIFDRLDRGQHGNPPSEVNGLTNLGLRTESPTGERTYSGQRPDRETVIYKYDAYGNLHGEGDKGNYYFQQHALNHPYAPLKPLTKEQYGNEVVRTSDDNVGMNDLNGLYQEFIEHLENPAYGVGDALDRAGVPKEIGEDTERYFNNPIGSALVDINKASGNWFGKQLGKLYGREIGVEEMNDKLDKFGLESQNVIPGYGRARFLCSLAANALKGELPDQKDQREMQQIFKEHSHEAAGELIR